jgi:phage tail-like protein
MRERPPRSFVLVGSDDAWRRCAHRSTALVDGVVQLAWTDPPAVDAAGEPPAAAAGLAFDRHCRLYHSLPEPGRVERVLWAAEDSPQPLDLFQAEPAPLLGDFTSTAPPAVPLSEPRGLAVDQNDRLFIAESGARRILIHDLWSRRLLAALPVDGVPLDLALRGDSVLALLASPPALLEITSRQARPLPLPAGVAAPARLAVSAKGELFVLDQARTPGAKILAAGRPALAVPRATDLDFQSGDALVVARFPGDDFRRFRISAAVDEIAPLQARGYDGLGIARAPDDRILFWTSRGFRHAVPARLRYASSGIVTTFRLDCGEFNTVWGRVFLDACIPRDTRVELHCLAADEPPEEATLARTPPANTTAAAIVRPDLSPPLPPLSLAPSEEAISQPLHRRNTGIEWPWAAPQDERFATYEAPVLNGPGRFLWITLRLQGNTRFTPRVRAVRAEYPSHDLMRRLPKVYSREAASASFLRRYLALFDTVFSELEGESELRHALLDPRSAPPGLLPWLAGFVGLTLDERWPQTCRRRMIQEAVWLFRFRGTIAGLSRFLELYLGRPVTIIEKYRVRGLGGALVGESSALQTSSVLGAGFRVGGAVGDPQTGFLQGTADDAFASHAHRFTVLIPALLTPEQMEVVLRILEVHRPAHTLVEVCTVGAGMRVGRGLHVELTSWIGPTGGFRPLQLDATVLGRDAVVGRPAPGTSPGLGRLGEDTRVG